MTQFIERMVRAAKLEPGLYEEVEADKEAMGQALSVVLLASLAAGIGSYARGGLSGMILAGCATLLGWYIWAYLTYWLGAKLLPESRTCTSQGELLRVLGFASVPGLLRVFGVVPGLTGIAFLLVAVWMLLATMIAVRQALDYTSTVRALGVCVPGWLIHLFILLPSFLLFGAAPGP